MFRVATCVLTCGIVFGLLASSSVVEADGFKTLYQFKGRSDGRGPAAPLIADAAGNFYGTTEYGGTGCGRMGCGTVFSFGSDGTHKVLYSFAKNRTDGRNPQAGLIEDNTGNLYGTTVHGGGSKEGTVFELDSNGAETVLHSFGKDGDGTYPYSPLVADKDGNLHGTTAGGGLGNCDYGCGIVFKVTSAGKETISYAFTGGSDGNGPDGGLIMDKAGGFFGTTAVGGGTGCLGDQGCGTIFELAPDGTERVLYSFEGNSSGDGAYPKAGLIADKSGNFFGTTMGGGSTGCQGDGYDGCGAVFRLAPNGKETVLYAFQGGSDGALPDSPLVMDKAGNLYGTTAEGGGAEDAGIVFKVTPEGRETVLHAFTGESDGASPHGLLADGKGNLYGTAFEGGKGGRRGCGTIFRIKE